jgi:hypothetical protein
MKIQIRNTEFRTHTPQAVRNLLHKITHGFSAQAPHRANDERWKYHWFYKERPVVAAIDRQESTAVKKMKAPSQPTVTEDDSSDNLVAPEIKHVDLNEPKGGKTNEFSNIETKSKEIDKGVSNDLNGLIGKIKAILKECSYGIDFAALMRPERGFHTSFTDETYTLHGFATPPQNTPPFTGCAMTFPFRSGAI